MQKQVSIVAYWWFQYILVVTAERHLHYEGVRAICATTPAKDIFLESLISTSDQIHHSTNLDKQREWNKKVPVALHPPGSAWTQSLNQPHPGACSIGRLIVTKS